MKEVYAFETRPMHTPRRKQGAKDDAVFVSLNDRPEMSMWIIDRAREAHITRAEVVRQCIEYVMTGGNPHGG